MGKIIAIDFGLKRTGLAITDEVNMFAFGLDTVDSKQLLARLKEIVTKESVSTIVLGLPKRLNNENSHITENVYLLKDVLEKEFSDVKIELYDERFTSKIASHSMHVAGATKKQKKEKGLIDKVSATILLQSYLTSLGL